MFDISNNNGIQLCTLDCNNHNEINRETFSNPLDSIKNKIKEKAEKAKKSSEKGKGKTTSKLKDKEKDFATKANKYSTQGQHIAGKIKSKLFGWIS